MVLSKASKDFKQWINRFKDVAQVWVKKSQLPRNAGGGGATFTPQLYVCSLDSAVMQDSSLAERAQSIDQWNSKLINNMFV